MTFTADIQELHRVLRTALVLHDKGEVDPAIKDVAKEAYALGMKRGIERTHAQVRRVVYTMVGMLAGVVALAVFAGWTV